MGRERSAFHPGPESFHSTQGRIHERRPTLSLSFFACNSAADHTWKYARQSIQRSATRHAGCHAQPNACGASGSFMIFAIAGQCGLSRSGLNNAPAFNINAIRSCCLTAFS